VRECRLASEPHAEEIVVDDELFGVRTRQTKAQWDWRALTEKVVAALESSSDSLILAECRDGAGDSPPIAVAANSDERTMRA
jgi:hypothetical protein